MKMNGVIWLAILLVAVFCAPLAGAEDPSEYAKIARIHLNYQDGSYTVSSVEVTYGEAPNLNLRGGELEGAILGPDGEEFRSFNIREPNVAYGDILGPPGEESLIGYTTRAAAGDLFIVIPYLDGMQAFTLTDTRDGSLLVTADLNRPVADFCSDYSQDPQCLVRITASPAGTPDTGTQLILATMFAASVFLAAGIALWTIRRRSAAVITVEEVPHKNTVLIVDDDPDIVELIDITLSSRGIATLKALSGEECLDILKKQVPDVILLDVMMDPMSGWETLEAIKKIPEQRDIPVMMLTGKSLTTQEAKKYRICIHDYLMKPFSIQELNAAVDQVLDRKRKLRESLALVKQAGVEQEKFCELVTLTRHSYVNQKLVEVLNIPQPAPVAADLKLLDDMLVVDYLKVKTNLNEKRANELRQEINTAFRRKGLPDFSW